MTRIPTAVAGLLVAVLGVAGCAEPQVEEALEPSGGAFFQQASGQLTMAIEVRNTAPDAVLVDNAVPMAGFRILSTEVLFGDPPFWVPEPEGLQPIPAELAPGETARVYITLEVTVCDSVGDWFQDDDGMIRFRSTIDDPIFINIRWADRPEVSAVVSLESAPAQQIPKLTAGVCL